MYNHQYDRKMVVSIIICTYNRQKWVEDLLVSISQQTVMPKDVILVDASPEKINYEIPEGLDVIIIQSAKMQLTYQKNLGLDVAIGDIIFFLDDDLLLDKNYIEQTVKVFDEDVQKRIGAVSGYITNQWGIISNNPGLFMKIAKLLNIYDGDFSPGSVSPSGVFIELNMLQPFSGVKKIDFVPGGCTAFRSVVFKKYRPPLVIDRYGGEDKTFSRIIARDWEMCVCGDAKLQHFSAEGGARQTDYGETKSTVKFNLFIQKNYGRLNQVTLRLRFYYILGALRMYMVSIIMFLSVVKIRKGSKWVMRATGYLVGALNQLELKNE